MAAEAQAAPQFDMQALATLIKDTVEATVGPLREELAEVRQGTPRFVKTQGPAPSPRRNTYVPPDDLINRRRLSKGQSDHQTARWLDTARGRETIPPDHRPIFRPGELVRLNPEASQHGDSRTWGEILANDRINPEGIGEIVGTMYNDKSWQPKYKVAIRGFSGGTVGVRESELLPYDD